MRNFSQALIVICAGFATIADADIDTCVVGTWWAEISDVADMMSLQMNGSARAAGGDVRMDVVPSGDFRITVRELRIDVQIPNTPQMQVAVSGYSAGNMQASDGAWLASVDDYNLVGSADVLGQTMTIPFTSSTGMFGGGLGAYTCTTTRLQMETDPTTPTQVVRDWRRG